MSSGGGAGAAGAPTVRVRVRLVPGRVLACGRERGSQALEFALVMPAVVVVLVVILHAAWLGSDLVLAQSLAREAARAASVGDDRETAMSLRQAAAGRPVELDLEPPDSRRRPGQLVTARVRVRTRAFAVFGVALWLPARAVMLVEAE